jgi:hypothetical protein
MHLEQWQQETAQAVAGCDPKKRLCGGTLTLFLR